MRLCAVLRVVVCNAAVAGMLEARRPIVKKTSPKASSISSSIRVNERIRAPEIRVIDDEGTQLGIMSVPDALRMAQTRELDLVEVAPNAQPPVCRLMNVGKYQYEQAKRDRQARKAQKQIEVKELRLRPKTDEHDIQVIIKKIRKFSEEGAKTRVRIRFRGREMQHPEVGRDLLDQVAKAVADVTVIESMPLLDGSSMVMVLAPSS